MVALAGMVCVFVVGIQPAASQPNDNEKKVRICHATSAATNPYVSNEPAIANNGDLPAATLTKNIRGPVFPAAGWGDIIPPYEYVDDKGLTQIFPGYNWTPRGQAIWENGCEGALRVLVPILECVDAAPGGGFLAHFGYQNPNPDQVVAPFENTFVPDPADRGQPKVFEPGRVKRRLPGRLDGVGVDVEADRQPGHGLRATRSRRVGARSRSSRFSIRAATRGVSTSRSTNSARGDTPGGR